MTEENCHIGGTDVVLPDVDEALNNAVNGLDALLAAIQRNVESGVKLPVAVRLLLAHPVAMQARDLCGNVFVRLYSGQPTADEADYDTPF